MKIELENAVVYHGSNLDVLPTLPDNSVDSIVTDPPYELGFMGKSWDNSGIAYSVELWTECMRVLKPGGHLLAFGGSRTWHRLAVAIEDAGFEMRDSIAWLYGSGFPKSMDISKAIDKGSGETKQRQLKFVNWMKATGLTASKCDQILKEAGHISHTSSHSIHYFNENQPQIATANTFDILRLYLPKVPEEIERLVAERTGIEWTAYKNREVVGTEIRYNEPSGIVNVGQGNRELVERKITTPATPEAHKWQGWGTALKPAFEPVVVARKPLIGTVAANVLAYGTGGLNIDASRIKTTDSFGGGAKGKSGFAAGYEADGWTPGSDLGRWPANIILDPYTAELLDEQSGISKSQITNFKVKGRSGGILGKEGADRDYVGGHSDSGGASRFFYVAKASKKDRNEGLEELPVASAAEMVDREEGSAGMNSPRAGAGRTSGSANIHPTVKPTALMEYLIKLVTPEGGTVLDPFTGSGSTGKAALLNGYQFIGIELTDEYLPIIEGRLKWANEQASKKEEEKSEVLF